MTISNVKTLSDAHKLAQETGKRLVIQNGFIGGAVAGEWYQDNILSAVCQSGKNAITSVVENERTIVVTIEVWAPTSI